MSDTTSRNVEAGTSPRAPAKREDRTAPPPTLLDLRLQQTSARAPVAVQAFGMTHRGKVRGSNEDQFLVATLTGAMRVEQSSFRDEAVRYAREASHVFVVADGMGGHAGGETASALAVATIEQFLLEAWRWVLSLDGPDNGRVLRDFQEALRSADTRVLQEADIHPELRGMGTTVTLAFADGSHLFLAHVGDSRAYLLRGGRLYRLTRDHTLVQALVDKGMVSPADAEHHDLKHVVVNVVGGGTPGVQTEIHRVEICYGDTLLLCTDGLTNMVNDDRIAFALQGGRDPKAICKTLVRAANDEGGVDNTTVIVARFLSPVR